MIVNRFEDGVPPAKRIQVLFHDIDIVASRVESTDAHLFALSTVITMIIVRANDSDPLLTKNAGYPSRDGGFSGRAIPNDAQ
jgi:hypothetical protein